MKNQANHLHKISLTLSIIAFYLIIIYVYFLEFINLINL